LAPLDTQAGTAAAAVADAIGEGDVNGSVRCGAFRDVHQQ